MIDSRLRLIASILGAQALLADRGPDVQFPIRPRSAVPPAPVSAVPFPTARLADQGQRERQRRQRQMAAGKLSGKGIDRP